MSAASFSAPRNHRSTSYAGKHRSKEQSAETNAAALSSISSIISTDVIQVKNSSLDVKRSEFEFDSQIKDKDIEEL